jgi:hypothetical protein
LASSMLGITDSKMSEWVQEGWPRTHIVLTKILPLMVLQRALLFLELTFTAPLDPYHHGWSPLPKGLVNLDGICIPCQRAMMSWSHIRTSLRKSSFELPMSNVIIIHTILYKTNFQFWKLFFQILLLDMWIHPIINLKFWFWIQMNFIQSQMGPFTFQIAQSRVDTPFLFWESS